MGHLTVWETPLRQHHVFQVAPTRRRGIGSVVGEYQINSHTKHAEHFEGDASVRGRDEETTKQVALPFASRV